MVLEKFNMDVFFWTNDSTFWTTTWILN